MKNFLFVLLALFGAMIFTYERYAYASCDGAFAFASRLVIKTGSESVYLKEHAPLGQYVKFQMLAMPKGVPPFIVRGSIRKTYEVGVALPFISLGGLHENSSTQMVSLERIVPGTLEVYVEPSDLIRDYILDPHADSPIRENTMVDIVTRPVTIGRADTNLIGIVTSITPTAITVQELISETMITLPFTLILQIKIVEKRPSSGNSRLEF